MDHPSVLEELTDCVDTDDELLDLLLLDELLTLLTLLLDED